MVKLLLAKGMDPDAHGMESYFMTALGDAVRYRHLEVVRLLLSAGADPNKVPSPYYDSMLDLDEEEEEDGEIAEREKADRQVWRDIVKLLVSYGHRLDGGHLRRAREAGCHPELQELLHELEASPLTPTNP
eukprot:gene13109-3646_t